MITPNTTTAAYDLYLPTVSPIPLVFDSPHSWGQWPEGAETAAPIEAILSGWDAFIDELWSDVVDLGGTLLAARFHRSFIDANRSDTDIDEELLEGPWPGVVNPTEKAVKGMGLIRRFALPGVVMYNAPLSIAEVRRRLDTYYYPYHERLAAIINHAKAGSDYLVHIDMHSMKSVGNKMNTDAGQKRPDIVVSDRCSTTADPRLTQWIAQTLTDMGFVVSVNAPYQGAEMVRKFGQPSEGIHSVQIELNRGMYMDENTFVKSSGFYPLKERLAVFQKALAEYLVQCGGKF